MSDKNNRTALIAGIGLFALAALITISLLPAALNFGAANPGTGNLLFTCGRMLFSVYRVSSFLVPVYLLVCGAACLDSRWSRQRIACIAVSIIPFFTIAIAEHRGRIIATQDASPIAVTKICILAAIALLLVVMEYLITMLAVSASFKDDILPALQGYKEKAAAKIALLRNNGAAAAEAARRKMQETFQPEEERAVDEIGEEAPEAASVEQPESAPGDDTRTIVLGGSAAAAEDDLLLSPEEAALEESVDANIDSVTDSLFAEDLAAEGGEDDLLDEDDLLMDDAVTDEELSLIERTVAEEDEAYADAQAAESAGTEAAGKQAAGTAPAEETIAAEGSSFAAPETAAAPVADAFAADGGTFAAPETAAAPAADAFAADGGTFADPETAAAPAADAFAAEGSSFAAPETAAENASGPALHGTGYDRAALLHEAAAPEAAAVMPEAEHSVIRTSLSEVFARMDEDAGAQLEPDSFMPDAHYTRDRAEHIPAAVPASYPMEARTPAHSAADAAAAEDSVPAYREAYAAAQADEAANAAEAAEAEEIPVEMDVGPVLGYESAGYESEALDDDAPEISGSADNGGQRYHEQIERNLTTEHAYEDSAADLADAADIDAAADADYEADSDAEYDAIRESDAISDSDAISEEDSITEAAANSEPAALADSTSSDDDDTYAPFPGDTLELEDESDYAEEDSASYEDAAEYQETEAAEADYTADEAPAQESAALPRAVQADGTPVPVPEQRQRRRVAHGPYEISTELLTKYEDDQYWIIDDETNQAAESLKGTLREFGIQAEVTGIRKGPVVTMFEILPAPGVKLSKIVALQDNIALRLAASSVRIVAPIPGKKAVGIEIPNKKRAIVSFRECIEQDLPEKMAVPVILGKDIEGETQIMDLVKTPHLLIAGSTGSGKSVCVNSIILSMLFKRSPNEVKMILIDPKIVELKLYNDIPHLLTPVITEPKRAMQALQYCLCEMERRYALLDGMGVRDISTYNKRIVERHIAAEKLPYLIVIIDEFADLMATTGKQLESVLARLAAMSRAVGIHLVLATQRPSIDVITGLIKANIPSRIAFMVASKTDSRIILDQMGADKLLGKGDMLYASSTDPFPVRIQGAFVSDQEVEDVVNAVKQWGEPEYIDDEIFVDDDEDEESELVLSADGEDPMYEKALDIVVQAGKASASYIQRRLKIGYNRAARLVEEMEERGIVGPANGSKPREIIHMP